MHKIPSLLMSGLILSFASLNAQAALTTSTVDGVNLVYSSIGNITWTQDANLLNSLQDSLGYDTVVNAIIAASPTVEFGFFIRDSEGNEQRGGIHTLSTCDFVLGGRVNWWGAKAFTNYLGSINYAGSSQWTLPSMEQFAQLLRGELEVPFEGPQIIPDTDNFINEIDGPYWSNTSVGPHTSWWLLPFGNTLHIGYNAFQPVWAISPGPADVAAVPVPATAWLFGSALLGFITLKRRSPLR